jgi:ABC-type branched-subunit amino acid transport system ATPase component/branched-subunit amino acid ABC-type transport system permease component
MEFVRFAILGLATGGIYAMISLGLVLVYRGSGLLNFAQGAMAMLGAYSYYELTVKHGVPKVAALVLALLICAVVGAAIHLLVLRPMRGASPLSRVVATLGIVLVLQSAAYLRYGHNPLSVPSLLPTKTVHVFSNQLPISEDRIYIFAICIVLSVGLYAVYRWTPFGRITTAVAENEVAAATFGYSPDLVAAANWAIGAVLAGLAGILIAPIIYLEPTSLVLLIIPAMSAALIGEFMSFPLTVLAALVLGISQSELQRYVTQPGWATAAPFIVVIAVLVVRGRSLPLRSFVLDRLPAVGSGRIRIAVVVVLYAVISWLVLGANPDWATATVTTFAMAIVCLSVVLLTGFTGQLSLAQFVLAGVGALLAARLDSHMTFLLALLVSAIITCIVGAVVGLPALRTRGSTLAVATLGLGGAVSAVVLESPKYTGGVAGIVVHPPTAFGWNLDPIAHPNRYAFMTFTILVLVALMIANLRRGATGRRLLAVRSNERAAASLGVHVAMVKTYAFTVSAGIAAIGGTLLAFVQPSIQVSTFDVFTSILIVAVTVAGGVGFVPGGFVGATMISGGIVSEIFHKWSQINDYLPLIGGAILILTLVVGPDGLFEMNRQVAVQALRPLAARIAARRPARRQSHAPAAIDVNSQTVTRVTPQALTVSGISVRFGGVHAVRDVSLVVRPGEVHGLIGPNGAGKTTFIDAVTGFVRTTSGSVRLGETEINRWAPRRRAAHGLSRSFQSLELFSDLTIAENLAVASDHHGPWRYLTDLIRPGRVRLSPAAQDAVRQFGLAELLSVRPDSVAFGPRKIVAIARSVASAPSVLLLDEPAAGLDDNEADELAGLIRHLADEWGIAVLLVEHKVDLILSVSDRITVLDNGAILASGTPEEIRNDPAVIDAYLGVVATAV